MTDRARRLIYVDDGVPEEGTEFLRASCEERGVELVPLDPTGLELHPEMRAEPGDLLYRPAISHESQRVEQYLYAPGVATFYRDPDGPFFNSVAPGLAFQHAGLPVPRSVHCRVADKRILDRYAERLGGYPLILKVSGFSRGVGVLRAESPAQLRSQVEFCLAMHRTPVLMAYVPDAVHWRMVVVGDRVVASYRNRTESDDFRSSATQDPADYRAEPPAGMAEVAVAATRTLRLEFGGVDLLHHGPSGRIYLLECNFPCYYAQAQSVAGDDVSGAMVDHLLAKAEALDANAGGA